MSRITPDQVAPLSARTQADLLSAAQQQEAGSFGNTIGNAFDRDVLTAAQTLVDPIIVASRFYQRYVDSPRATSGFRLSEERLAQLTEGVDPVYWNEFAYINSEDEALIVRGQTLEKTKARATTAEAGWGGVGATLGASVFNPVSVLLGAATGVAAAAPAVNATRAARIARLIEAGAINAVPQAAVDSLVAADNADINALDVLSGAAGGFGLGAAINRFGSAGLGTRALAAGAGQAVPAYLVDQLQTERTQTEILGAFALNLAFGAGIGAISKASPIGQEFEAHGRKVAAQVDQKALAEEGLPSSWVEPEVDQTTLRDLAGFYEEDLTQGMVATTASTSVPPMGVDVAIPVPEVGPSVVAEPIPVGGKQPWQMTRSEYEATGLNVYHGTNRQFDTFDPAARDRFGKERTRSDRFYFTEDRIVADTFANATGYRQVSYDNWAAKAEDAGKPSTLEDMRKSLNSQINKGSVLWYSDPELGGRIVQAKSVYELSDDILMDGDVRLYPKGSEPRVIETKIYGNVLDLTAKNVPDWVPENIKKHGKDLSFAHEYDANLSKWMRDNGISAVRVSDVSESGFSSIIALPEAIGLNRDPHREAVKAALDAGRSVPREVLNDYPDLAPRAVASESPAAPAQAVPPAARLGGVPTNTPSVRPGIVQAVQNKPQNFFVPGAVASREATFKNNYQPGDFDASGVTAAQPSLQSGRFDPVAMIGRNGTDTERLLANAIVTDPFGRADGSPASIGAENWANSRAEGITTEYLRGQDRLYRQYVDAQKKAAASLPPGTEYKIPSRTEFNGMVHYAVLRYGKTPRGTTATEIGAISDAILQDPIIQAAAKHHYDTVSKPTLEMMKRHGVRGAANIQDDPSYVSVVAKRADIDAFILAKPDNLDRLREVVAEGIVRKMRESKVDPFSTLFPVLAVQDIQQVRNRIATEIADQWIKNVGTNNEEMARASRSALSSAQLEQLVPRLAQDTGLNEQQIKSILFEFNPGEEANDVPASFLKPRIDIDYTVSKQYPDGQTVRIEDFLENDIEGIARRYIRKATGASAMAEVGRVAKERLGLQEAPSTIDDFVELARVSQRARPDDGADDLARLEILFKKTYGYPTEVPVTATGKAVVSSLRFVRALTRFRVMTTLAALINQMTEYAPLIAKHGPSMVFRAVPAAREFINEVKSGKPIAHGLMAMALRDGIGLGSVSERVNPVAPMADNTLVASGVSRAERAAGSLDRASMYLSRGQQRLSLEMYVRDFQERVAFFTAAQTWADQALGRKAKIDNPKTLADMGLTKAQYDAINAHLEKHATASDIGIDEPNLDKWTDANGKPDIRSQALYRQALLREAQFGINTGQSTLLPGWTDTTAGKMLSQLSTYGIQSYTTRFLPLLRSPDEFKTYASLLSMSVFGTMAYVTWTYMASLGMEENERRRFLERRLSDSAIAKAAFSRASFSSLAPRFIDAGLVLAGEDPAFAPSRVSGVGAGEGDQVVNILLGVPSVEQFKKTIDAAQSMTLPWLRDDYDFSQRDVRNILDGWGVPQWLNARNVIMRSVSDLPERPN